MTPFLTVSKNGGCKLQSLHKYVLIGFIFVSAVPKVQFRNAVNEVDEDSGQVSAIVYRSGDVSYKSTVRCYSRQGTAQVMMDFNERPNTDASIITFLPGGAGKPNRYTFFFVVLRIFDKSGPDF